MKKTLFILTLALSFGFASEAYLSKDSTLFKSPSNKETFGEITFSTKVKVLKNKNSFSNIEIDGWIADGQEDLIYKKLGVIIEYAFLNENGIKNLKFEDKKIDEYESLWHKVKLKAWVKTEDLVKSLDKQWEKLSNKYQNACGVCHAVHDVKEFDANTWPSLLNAMADRAGLTPNDKKKISKFLQNNSK